MLAFCLIGFVLVVESYGRQAPAPPPGITVYRTANPRQFLVPTGVRSPADLPPGFSQVAVVIVPRPAPIVHASVPSQSEQHGEGYNQEQNVYYRPPPSAQDEQHNEKPTVTFTQLVPHHYFVKKKIYLRPKPPIVQQFLKEVTPTTQTAYSEQQAASLRYAQTAPPQALDQDVLKITRDNNQPQPYHRIHQQQLVPQQNIDEQHEQNYPQPLPQPQPQPQPQAYPVHLQYHQRENPPPRYQPTHIQPQTTNAGLTYIPINPVMFQKPLVDDDPPTPTPKHAIYLTQKKKYPAPSPEDDSEEDKEPPRKVFRPQQRYFPIQSQIPQFLIPIVPQHQQDDGQQLQPQLVRVHIPIGHHQQPTEPAQQEASEPAEQQEQPQPQPYLIPIRSKKVQHHLLRQPSQQIVAYHPVPLQQPLPTNLQHPNQIVHQRPVIRYLVRPQIFYQPLQHVQLRQPQSQQQQENDFEHQEEAEPQQDLQQQVDRNEYKPEEQQRPKSRRPPSFRTRKYRPRVQQEEEEQQNENQEQPQENQEVQEFRSQYSDVKTPITYGGLRYRRPIHITSRQLTRGKDRAVQIVDEENEEYK